MKILGAGWFVRLLAVAVVVGVLGCAAGCGANREESFVAPPILPLVTVVEMQPVKSVDVLGHPITWATGATSGDWGDPKEIERGVHAAIGGYASRLAAVDYTSLSASQFVTQTRGLTLKPSDFTGQGVYEDARGEDDNGQRWRLYVWKGPEFPKHPERPLVSRWVYVYALYHVRDKTIDRLIATIGGEVQE
jgi:hypothetical protein